MAIAVIVGLAVLILIHEAGHFAAAKLFGVRVEEFGIGFPPRIFARRKGETEYSVNALPIGGFVRLAHEEDASSDPRSFSAQPAWKKLLILVAGIAANIAIAWLLFVVVFSVGAPLHVVVTDVAPGSPAATAGIESGDMISGFSNVDDFIAFSHGKTETGTPVPFLVVSGGTERAVAIEGRRNPPAGEGSLGIALVGVGIQGQPFFRSLSSAAIATYETFCSVGAGIWGIVSGIFSGGSLGAVSGPVGIVAMASKVGASGFTYLLQLIAVISVNLAVLNLVPFPALDGGRAAVVIAEAASRRRIPNTWIRGMNAVGFILLLVLMVLVTIQDIVRLV
jgi:regulator of sigma E protease